MDKTKNIVQYIRKQAKVIFFALATLLVVCIHFCLTNKEHEYPSELTTADALCENNPDSAMTILKKYTPKNSLDRNYKDIVLLKANCKKKISYRTIPELLSDMIKKAEKEKMDKRNLSELYYYSGCVYRNLNDDPQASDCYFKALDIYSALNDNKMQGRTNSQIANILINQCLYAEAEKYLKEAIINGKAAKDYHWVEYAIRDLAWCYSTAKRYNAALYTYKRGLKMATATKDSAMAAYINTQLASLLLTMSKYEEAERAIDKALAFNSPEDRSPNLCILIKIYNATGRKGKTKNYCEELLQKGNIYGKQFASQQLALTYLENGESGKAKDMFAKSAFLTDSIREITAADAVAKSAAAYNQNKLIRHEQELRESKQQQATFLIIIVLVLTLGIIFLLFTRKDIIHKRNEEALRNLTLTAALEKYRQNAFRKEEKLKQEIDQLSEQIKRKEAEMINIRVYENAGKEDSEDDKASSIKIKELLNKYPIYEKFVNAAASTPTSCLISDNDWKELEKAAYEIYPGMRDVVYGMRGMTMVNKRITILLKFGFRPASIAKLMYKERSSINSARKRLFERNFGREGTGSDWDKFVIGIC